MLALVVNAGSEVWALSFYHNTIYKTFILRLNILKTVLLLIY